MKKFDKRFKIGTRVKLVASHPIGWCDDWRKIQTIHETRKWVTLEGLGGSFQRGHILRFTNKASN